MISVRSLLYTRKSSAAFTFARLRLSLLTTSINSTRQYSTRIPPRSCSQCCHNNASRVGLTLRGANYVKNNDSLSLLLRQRRSFGSKSNKPTRKERKAMALAQNARNRNPGDGNGKTKSNSNNSKISTTSTTKSTCTASNVTTGKQARSWPRNREQVKSMALRIPPLILLGYGLMVSSDHPQYGYKYGLSPGGISMCFGPSMVPTLLNMDVVLRESISYRLPSQMLRRELQVGDIVIYVVDAHKGFCKCRFITKRIVATSGMVVDKFGQYAGNYGQEMNWGIQPDPNDTSEMVENEEYVNSYGRKSERKVVVPPGHLWLEGDTPLYSIDSRHYGPVPVTAVRGRLICRIWPWKRGGERDGGLLFKSTRPEPPSEEDLVSGRYDFVKVQESAAAGS